MQYLFQYLYVFLQAPSQQFNYYYHSQVFTILSCCPFITLFACLALSQPLLMSAIFCMSDLSLLCLLSGWLYKYLIWKWKANTKSYWQNADFSSSCVCVFYCDNDNIPDLISGENTIQGSSQQIKKIKKRTLSSLDCFLSYS